MPHNVLNIAWGNADPSTPSINSYFIAGHLVTQDHDPTSHLDVRQRQGDSYSLFDMYRHGDHEVLHSQIHQDLMIPYGLADWFGTHVCTADVGSLVLVSFFARRLEGEERLKLYRVLAAVSGALRDVAVQLRVLGDGSLERELRHGRGERGVAILRPDSGVILNHVAASLLERHRRSGNSDVDALLWATARDVLANWPTPREGNIVVPYVHSRWDTGIEIRIRSLFDQPGLLCAIGPAHEPDDEQWEILAREGMTARYPPVYSGRMTCEIGASEAQKRTLGPKIDAHLVRAGERAVIKLGSDIVGVLEPVTRASLRRVMRSGAPRQTWFIALTTLRHEFHQLIKQVHRGACYMLTDKRCVVAVLSGAHTLSPG